MIFVMFLFNLAVMYIGGFSSIAVSPPAQVAPVSFRLSVDMEIGWSDVKVTVIVDDRKYVEGKGNYFWN